MSDKQPAPTTSESIYTQREWDRIVGIGSVPDEYSRKDKRYTIEELKRLYDRG